MVGTPQVDTTAEVADPKAEPVVQPTGFTSEFLELTRPPSTDVSDRIRLAQAGGDIILPNAAVSPGRQVKLNEFGQYTYRQDGAKSTLEFEGARRDFNFTLNRFGNFKDIELQEKGQSEKLNLVPQFDSKARENLFYSVNREIKDVGLNSKFLADMIRFEQRALKAGLTPQQVSDSYSQINRILSAGNKELLGTKPADRILLAQQLMAQVADPTLTTQAADTCAPTVAEILMHARHPERSTKFIADLITTGKFKAPDGTTVNVDKDALKPMLLTDRNPPDPTFRSYLNQVFTAHSVDLLLNAEGKNQIYKEIFENGKSTYELHSTIPPFGKVEDFKGLSNDRTGRIYDMISGADKRRELVSLDFSDKPRDRTETFSNFEQFQEALKRASQTKSLPIGLGVNSGIKPLWNGVDTQDMTGGHILVIQNITYGPDGKPDQITIYDQGAIQKNQFRTMPARQAFEMTSTAALDRSTAQVIQQEHPEWSEIQRTLASKLRIGKDSNYKPMGFELNSLMGEISKSPSAEQSDLLSSHERLYESASTPQKLDYLYFQGHLGLDQNKFFARLGKILLENKITAPQLNDALANFDDSKTPTELPALVARLIKSISIGADEATRQKISSILGK